MVIGVLALQGAFIEHQKSLAACGVDSIQVRKPHQLEDIQGLIIPGGESTTMGKLMNQFELFEPIVEKAHNGLPLFGTCAGMIMLAKDIAGSTQPRLGLMDIEVERNAFGRQVESFETELTISELGEAPVRAVFIRAPYIKSVAANVKVLAKYNEKIVLAQQDHYLVAAFHPELTNDVRLHQHFLKMIK
ncbi:pyridoxal phosphate synthase yaaE subunit [Desulforamulus reducens MI-1]|uniref:Pyridoxal 5'-phosphate synthase subunit PdxT n=1 Tax=Desulforamulus reducens (strain ATCC BAA-1160 / DSM 100696 / MI-1) TaxID=349161 RepID=PDXT_DESRM|nr:pyridoxal 5'-phosphate synthase glutaminase subunit PdxT [Desulforamulus reducens]A4J0G0.1 RecName: Full=Pyridoxal 5'-phosphate synthase subunit PdxT; AltName: Full=Pdx2; AltName: Full=Pyridoxal 5'-phosphate synthase glutaminase subunit [Desulforamulus reducens MI-1]ABO48563.1 pyridoxal phosphate synthase yaaE subunit [Desulforamulus reducens MI-1]